MELTDVFTCALCNKIYSSKEALSQHETIHPDRDERMDCENSVVPDEHGDNEEMNDTEDSKDM